MSAVREAGPLGAFSEAARTWFADALGEPTEVQERAWEAIAAGENALVIAPTGSGKTLAAFLWAIDTLMAEKAQVAEAGKKWVRGVRVLYVSPLKALGADVDRNLQGPLTAISELVAARAGRDGAKPPEVRTAMRTGDTTPDERRKIVRNPPDILITTPESLYLMLTSAARDVLRHVETVIVDEVHALAGDKRGAHLSLSLERLDDLLDAPAQRIGLSATVRPRDEIARFLGGVHPVTVVAAEAPPALDLSVCVPVSDMTAVPVFGGFRSAGDGTCERGSGPRRAPVEQAWKSDRALRAVMRDEAAPPHPDSRLGTASIWPHIEAAILDEVLAHTSTIVFVNSRGLCEKLTARLNELYAKRLGLDAPHAEAAGYWSAAGSAGEGPGAAFRSDIGSTTALVTEPSVLIAKAHHGSVSKEKRLQVERELKAGELPCVVATSSLELGIDMGSIDLVLQVAAPFSVASGLQRVGRANHQVGGRSRGIIFPRTRVEVIDAAVMAEGMESGAIEATRLVRNALDVLAQQTVAAVAMAPDGLPADGWLACVRRSACYADLGRRSFEGVLDMLAGRYGSGDVAEFAPRILWDRETGLLKPRPGSQRLAVTAAGTIPDRGMFSVVLPEGDAKQGRRRVGELDEEMVMESRVGDIIALGTSTWHILEIGADRVIVEAAPGRAARLPFWHGEAVGRPFEAGRARGAFVRALDGGLASDAGGECRLEEPLRERLAADGLDENARGNLAALVQAQRACTGIVPTDKRLVVEQCEDETGDWRVILHSPFGRRVHEPWALAVGHRIMTTRGFDAQVAAADDGIVLRVPMAEGELYGAELFLFDADEAEAIVRECVGNTTLFAARFRECAARALLMSPTAPGKRAPLWQQRLKGGQLLEAARREEDFPIILEAMRECLQDVFDLPGLREVLGALQAGAIKMSEARTAVPSPFAAPLVFGYLGEHLYEGDLPHAERQASLLTVDPALLAELVGAPAVEEVLDAEVTAQVLSELQRTAPGWRVHGAEGVADLLRELGPLTAEEVAARMDGVSAAEGDTETPASASAAKQILVALEAERRVFPATIVGAEKWAAADDGPRLRDVLGIPVPPWALPERGRSGSDTRPLDGLMARFARTHTLFSADEAAAATGVGAALAAESLERLAADGRLARLGADRWADGAVLRRLRSRSLARAREAVRPVASEAYVQFLMERQGVAASGEPALAGIDGVAQVIAQFEGAALPMAQWESDVFPVRVPDYRPAMLDELVAAGEVLWAASTVGGAHLVSFFPTDSPLAPLPADPASGIAAAVVPEPGVGEGGVGPSDTAAGSGGGIGASPAKDGEGGVASAERQNADAAVDDGKAGLDSAVRHALAAEGPLAFPALVDAVSRMQAPRAPASCEVAEALERLVWAGEATADGLGLPRAGGLASPSDAAHSGGQVPPPSRRRATSRRGRTMAAVRAQARAAVVSRQGAAAAFDAALAGRWRALAPCGGGATVQALALVESLIDRYGVVTRDIALAAGVPGGLSALYPVLRAMEDAGELARGMFVEGMGPAQFAPREVVEALRAHALASHSAAAGDAVPGSSSGAALADAAACTVLPADDPACLFGAGIPWPDVAWEAAGAAPAIDAALVAAKPTRREGALVVVTAGRPVLWAAPRCKSVLAFTSDPDALAAAVASLAAFVRAALKREGSAASRRKIVVEHFNARDVLDTPLATLLQAEGFVRLPDGMRLYASPF
ncbi:DEAD/DEAH box helicase [Adlercreutzia sp. R21]|uniref:DEAD/DEAH box helicase n=1 Tax=Adlercreutzia wanghongyangiae TaxID=3111451 RepID=UPI002DB89F4D|nr:DEAD/DEAH box helicase [Adlercreutzia sp. R21]MEC4184747.1 DEAD/DEAH box helicase [Adlercreutzia sp. R21]